MDKFFLITGILLAAGSVFHVLRTRSRSERLLRSLESMICQAREGSFSESSFDESRLSKIESEMADFLSASTLSARNVEEERDRIKTLISDISHQTKTPIANLILYGELLAEGNLSEEERSNVEAILGQSEKLRFLIDCLVKLSRLEHGILSLSPERQAVAPLLSRTVESMKPKADEKGIELRIERSEDSAVFDEKWTTEALMNLVDNAIKYTEKGTVSMSTVAYESFLRIDIADTGIGIAEEEHAKIFGRFYRSEQTKNIEGVGIGLYLAREILSAEGGYIKVNSAPGRGSVFSVFLPR